MIANYHTHLALCKHATGTMEEYIERAIDQKLSIIGISDHIPYNNELTVILNSRRMSVEEFQNYYLPGLKEAKKKYGNKIEVLSAGEIEYYDDYRQDLIKLRDQLDYLILGQHDIIRDGQYKSIYNPSFDEVDLIIYRDMVIRALQTGLFRILAHPDIFMLRYPVFDKKCREASLAIIATADACGVAIELNANGIRRNKFKGYDYFDEALYLYPHVAFWDIVAEYQKTHPSLEVILNDDCHHVDCLVDDCTELAYKFAERHHIKLKDKIAINPSVSD